jgi:HSP20 family molecular chaperone IbpA
MPENADCENVCAKYENGILHLEINKKEVKKPEEKNIQIQ